MGKIDDMRRLREQQFADTEKRRVEGAKTRPVVAESPTPKAAVPAPKSEPATKSKSKPDADKGKCPDCGKVKPVQNGVMASHQKGFGKACPGTRKKPV